MCLVPYRPSSLDSLRPNMRLKLAGAIVSVSTGM